LSISEALLWSAGMLALAIQSLISTFQAVVLGVH
jgi:hypothetical protein